MVKHYNGLVHIGEVQEDSDLFNHFLDLEVGIAKAPPRLPNRRHRVYK